MAASSVARGRSAEVSPAIKLEIVDVEKVKGLSNYYAYIIKVLCKDGSTYHIYRRYSQFDELQNSLEKRFPIEAGSINAKDRVLPRLPAKKFLGRSAIREVTDKRLPILNSYLQNLFALPNKIRYDTIVNAFVRATPDDQSRPYTGNQAYKDRPNGVVKPDRPAAPHLRTLRQDKPDRPPPMIKLPGSQKSPPSIPLPQRPPALATASLPSHPPTGPRPPTAPKPSAAPKTSKGKALYDYTAQHSDELSFKEGDTLILLELIDRDLWWRASFRGKQGIAPANYLEVVSDSVRRNWKDSVQDSDEWDSSEDEGEGVAQGEGSIVYYYNDAPRSVTVAMELITNPNYVSLYRAIQKQIRRHDIVLNYKDVDGDLVQLTQQEDMQLLPVDATPPKRAPRQLSKSEHAPWAIYITRRNDNSVYNTAPPSKKL